MKKERILWILLVTITVIIILNTFSGSETPEQYVARVIEHREQKNTFFLGQESPLTVAQKDAFEGLNYFPPNPEFVINGDLRMIENPKVIKLATSDGVTKEYKEFAYIEFELEGKTHKLLVFEMPEPYEDQLFLPFADETSTLETYGAGRYLELTKTNGPKITVDFNFAYNPYCAYVDDFSCPFPPRENILDISIEAGEKKYH